MPTGTPIHDIRKQLFEAAERVLLRNGPDALTSRAVTTEAGVAKGILHRYFPDFEAFLAALALTHIERLDSLSKQVRAAAGEETVAGNIAKMLTAALAPATIRIIDLVCSRQELGERLRLTTPRGIPVAAEITRMLGAYLTAERGLGRLAITTDVDMLAILLVGGAHLRASERNDLQLDSEDLRDLIAAAIGNTLTDQRQDTNRT
ncbi:MAG: TetR/AcrR family transcriptional regulator [Solirubrobacteraceae bacterium]